MAYGRLYRRSRVVVRRPRPYRVRRVPLSVRRPRRIRVRRRVGRRR